MASREDRIPEIEKLAKGHITINLGPMIRKIKKNMNFAFMYGAGPRVMQDIMRQELQHCRCVMPVKTITGRFTSQEVEMERVILEAGSELIAKLQQTLENNQERASDFIEDYRTAVAIGIDEILEEVMGGTKMKYDPMTATSQPSTWVAGGEALDKLKKTQDRIGRCNQLIAALDLWGEDNIQLTLKDFDDLVRDEW